MTTSNKYHELNICSNSNLSDNYYGTCSTAASTAAKVASASGFALSSGNIVSILFSTANTAGAITLNVNSTGAKTVYYGSAATSSSNTCSWDAGTVVSFMYDGTYFHVISMSPAASSGGGGADFEASTTTFDSSGNVTQTYSDRVYRTTFNADGTITETLTKTGASTPYATKTTTFNSDGSISETVS